MVGSVLIGFYFVVISIVLGTKVGGKVLNFSCVYMFTYSWCEILIIDVMEFNYLFCDELSCYGYMFAVGECVVF